MRLPARGTTHLGANRKLVPETAAQDTDVEITVRPGLSTDHGAEQDDQAHLGIGRTEPFDLGAIHRDERGIHLANDTAILAGWRRLFSRVQSAPL